MTVYKYRAFDPSGKTLSGEMAANTVDEAEAKIVSQSLTIISIVPLLKAKEKAREAEQSRVKSPSDIVLFQKKPKIEEIAVALRSLAVMAEAGVPVVEALAAVEKSCVNPILQEGLRRIRSDIMQGRSLAQAMRSAPKLFQPVLADMVSVAEEGGHLDRALANAATYVERSSELRKKVLNALMYPLALTSVSTVTVIFLIIFILPKFAETFKGMGAKLPALTQKLIDLGTLIKGHPLQSVVFVIGLVFAIKKLLSIPKVKAAVGAGLLRVPVLGDLLMKLAMARTLQTLSALLGGNVPLIVALEHAGKVSNNPRIEKACTAARYHVETGGQLADSFADSKVFSATIVQMTAVGERTGRLQSLIASASGQMEIDADARLKALIAIFEPMMILMMGFIVGFITVSVITPIYSLMEQVK